MSTPPKNKPQWLDDILDIQNQHHCATTAAISRVDATVSTMATSVNDLKTDIASAVGRIDIIDNRSAETVSKVNSMEEKFDEKLVTLKREIFDRMEACFSASRPSSYSSSTNTRHQGRPNLKEPTLIADLPSAPSTDERYGDLIEEAEGKRLHFIMGPTKTDNKPNEPTVSSSEILRRFFPTVSFRNNGPVDSPSFYRRLLVDRAHFRRLKSKMREHSGDLRNLNWWIAAERPQRTRPMASNAIHFISGLKESYPSLKQHYWDVDGAYLTCDTTDIVPVSLIPRDHEAWPHLFPLVKEITDGLEHLDWGEQRDHAEVTLEVFEAWLGEIKTTVSYHTVFPWIQEIVADLGIEEPMNEDTGPSDMPIGTSGSIE